VHYDEYKKVKDVMIPLDEYPHVQLNVNIYDALLEIQEKAAKGFRHLLIFDKTHLIAVVSAREILRDMAPGVFRAACPPTVEGYCPQEDPSLAVLWEDSFARECKKNIMKPLEGIITPGPFATVDSEAPITKALFMMLRDDKNALPVTTNHAIIGVVRLPNILDLILEKCE